MRRGLFRMLKFNDFAEPRFQPDLRNRSGDSHVSRVDPTRPLGTAVLGKAPCQQAIQSLLLVGNDLHAEIVASRYTWKVWRTLVVTILLVGCGNSDKVESTHPKTSPPAQIDPSKIPAEPIDAAEVAGKVGFPLLDHPSRPSVALYKKVSETEDRYDLTQTTSDAIRDVIKFYEAKLKLTANGSGDGATLMGYAPNGLMVMMNFAQKDSETVVGAKLIQSSAKP